MLEINPVAYVIIISLPKVAMSVPQYRDVRLQFCISTTFKFIIRFFLCMCRISSSHELHKVVLPFCQENNAKNIKFYFFVVAL